MMQKMYLSRIAVDVNEQRTIQALDNPEILHGIVESCFTGDRKRNLWRLDDLRGEKYLLLLSREQPDFSKLATQIGKDGEAWEIRDYQPLINRIQNGSVWRFRLIANPVMSLPQKGKGRGRIKAITIASHQKDWLVRQAERNGFLLSPNQFDVTRSEWKVFRNKGKTISILSATFEGILAVSDTELFIRALQEGIGRGKAYGMGLLTIMSYEFK